VDTYLGMKRGVPRLLRILKSFDIRATFFLSFGPDASGRAILQIIKNPRFLRKMLRTGAGSLYGWRTALYGTILPSPMIALSFPQLVQEIIASGHEVEFHAWDHRRWQDELVERRSDWIEKWFQEGIAAYRKVVGHEPTAFGAPGWVIDDRVLSLLRQYPFRYLSCTRAATPFIHEIAHLPEIPSDLPCLEEIGIDHGVTTILKLLERGGTHVLPVHAEVEGGVWGDHFEALLLKVRQLQVRILTLGEIYERLRIATLPVRHFESHLLPGRAVPCAV